MTIMVFHEKMFFQSRVRCGAEFHYFFDLFLFKIIVPGFIRPLLNMVFDGNATRNKSGTANEGAIVETALDWFCRSQRQSRRKRRLSGSSCNGVGNDNGISDDLDADIPTDPSIAAWNFLQFGKSGIAPIDEAWKRSCDGTKGRGQRPPGSPLLLPPVTILEGPKDVGKTWMVLTLAARFVVATRASRFKDFNNNDEGKGICVTTTDEMRSEDTGSGGSNANVDDDENGNRSKKSDQPIVVLADSTYDFTISQLVTVVRMTLSRERKRQHLRETNMRNIQPPDGSDNDKQYNADRQCQNTKINERTIEEELDCQERERISFKQDMEDCLSRIHVIQVDNGSIGWVPMLEALTYQLDDNRRRRDRYASVVNSGRSWHMEASTKGPPTLLLWDGFLSDVAFSPNVVTSGIIGDSIGNYNTVQATFESPGTQELLRQISRLLQKHPDTLWLVLTTRTVSVTSTATAQLLLQMDTNLPQQNTAGLDCE